MEVYSFQMCIIDLQQIALTGNIHHLSNYLSSADKMDDKWRYWGNAVVLMLSSKAGGNDVMCFDGLGCLSQGQGPIWPQIRQSVNVILITSIVPLLFQANGRPTPKLFKSFVVFLIHLLFSKNFRKTNQTATLQTSQEYYSSNTV